MLRTSHMCLVVRNGTKATSWLSRFTKHSRAKSTTVDKVIAITTRKPIKIFFFGNYRTECKDLRRLPNLMSRICFLKYWTDHQKTQIEDCDDHASEYFRLELIFLPRNKKNWVVGCKMHSGLGETFQLITVKSYRECLNEEDLKRDESEEDSFAPTIEKCN